MLIALLIGLRHQFFALLAGSRQQVIASLNGSGQKLVELAIDSLSSWRHKATELPIGSVPELDVTITVLEEKVNDLLTGVGLKLPVLVTSCLPKVTVLSTDSASEAVGGWLLLK
ncbi:unnamed protein product [Meganyctiphanes norvegica]|uniref:Uncharacterized protein n=1 Tax=Meganyctiphanes norvegica TaxID=48144 RepID=A0AAV2RDV1_MEGNR